MGHETLLIGSPNSGKSLLFNRLTGLAQKVANFPGITVSLGRGALLGHPELTLLDFPGTYSLAPLSGEERIASDGFHAALAREDLKRVLCVIDATRLGKSLNLALQVLREAARAGRDVLLVATMIDAFPKGPDRFDVEGLSAALGVPVYGVSSKTGEGLDALRAALAAATPAPSPARFHALDDEALQDEARSLTVRFGAQGALLLQGQTRLDSFFLHSLFGGVAFFALMAVLFQAIFTWAAPAMDGIELALGWMADVVVPRLPHPMLQDFAADALFGGVGAFLVFVPQIFVLTIIVGLMEDSGYMARAAVICHRPLRAFGLTGKSFVPMLSGVACAIPGIYAARVVESPRKRWLTYLAVPLMPCSARLPVYTLLIAAFIPATPLLGGLLGLQGLAMVTLYLFGLMVGLLVSALVAKFAPATEDDPPFVLEMPPYRLPAWQPLLSTAFDRSKHFVTKAGAVIFMVTAVVWVLGYFPNQGADLGASWLGALGRLIEPLFAPLGLDWRYGVAILTAFLAREVFVGTLGAIFGIEGADENYLPLVDQIQASGLGLGSGLALLVFFAIALQCVSTVALLARESGSWRLPLSMVVAYLLLAYAAAWVAFLLAGLLL
jgi:ferrous iron transport protein B